MWPAREQTREIHMTQDIATDLILATNSKQHVYLAALLHADSSNCGIRDTLFRESTTEIHRTQRRDAGIMNILRLMIRTYEILLDTVL